MQPLQPVSIELIKSMLRIRFMNAFNVLADLSAVASFPHSLGLWVGRCDTAPHTLTLFKTNVADFPTLFKTEFRFFNTLFKTFNPNIN